MTAEDDYEVVSLKLNWALVSLACFLLTLPAEYLLQFLPWRPRRIWLWPLIPPLVIFGLSTVGLLAGLVGLVTSDRKGLPKVAILLNGVVVLIVLVMAAVWFYIVSGRS